MKYKGTLVFKETKFSLDVSSSEKIEANPSLNPDGDVNVIKFTPAEEFIGEKSKVIHIDHLTLHMYSKFGHDLASPAVSVISCIANLLTVSKCRKGGVEVFVELRSTLPICQ